MRAPSPGSVWSRFGSRACRAAAATWLATSCAILVAGDAAAAQASAAAHEAAGEADAASPFQPGVIARYQGGDGVEHARLESEIALACGASAPDPRLPGGPFSARYDAQLLVQSPGLHTLRVYAAGQVRVTLAGKKVLDAASKDASWHDAQPVELPFGHHPLHVEYERGNGEARLALFWEGPNFVLEPLAARWLFHERGKTPSGEFERGRRLVRALRCAACHDLPGEPNPPAAPALDRLAGNIHPAWIVARLTAASPAGGNEATRPAADSRMPHFALRHGDAEIVASYLCAGPVPPDERPVDAKERAQAAAQPPPADPAAQPPPPPSAEIGRTLFETVGCLACHTVGQAGADGLFGGGDLSTVASKRPAGYFARWLTDPIAINRDHRMPVFTLTNDEVTSLSLYLKSLSAEPLQPAAGSRSNSARAQELLREHRCGACHALPGGEKHAAERLPLDVAKLGQPADTCLAEADLVRSRPGYALDEDDRRAATEYLTTMVRAGRRDEPRQPSGRDLLVERNCLACHERGHAPGLAPVLANLVDGDTPLREALAGMTPPALLGVGDKLLDEALAVAIRASGRPRYTWLHVRMPKFPLSDEETASLVRHFVDTDRVPARQEAPNVPSAGTLDPLVEGAGARLVTADGFGCTSCHAIGDWQPQKVAAGAEGIELSELGRRVRREWFVRWVRNPVRTVPQLEMPSIVQPIRGVLDGDLDRQIAAIWDVLGRPGFTPPAPAALRVVRRANLPDVVEPAAVLTDVIEIGKTQYVKPLVIGLANRHNVLFDLGTGRLAAWWIGDTARQQTRGKSWYWEAGRPQLLPQPSSPSAATASDIQLVRDGQRFHVMPRGQYVTEPEFFEHVAGGIEFAYRLRYAAGDEETELRIVERYARLPTEPSGGASGFRRSLQVEGLPAGAQIELVALPGEATLDGAKRGAALEERGTKLQATVQSPPDARFGQDERRAVVALHASGGRVSCQIDYLAELPVDQFAPRPALDRSVVRAELQVVPGFEAIRLPLTDEAMPTALGWRSDGTLIVSSLEGRVWLGRDTDGDGSEDRLSVFSDDLAAPWGVAPVRDRSAADANANDEPIDVVNKYGLLRLFDADGDGRAERTELVASGWGHTSDYHDWAVGLPRDAEGNYFVSLPCQQDDRSPAAAALRGTIVKLVPREPTSDDPRRFAVEPVCAGLRFGQGLALSSEGDLFVTDNQGNYTPFNELNHVVAGARYGFINRLERKRGFDPPFRPAAINIPHPWTRSVNGICFLAPPRESAAHAGAGLFGPFAGHLIGCEYDTRRLVRMSLERVAGEWQGAVYPFSLEPAAGEETFEGPLCCHVSPAGDMYVGNIRDSGWGAGTNTGSIVRLRWQDNLPAGIAAVRANAGGFTIDFTQPVDRQLAGDPANYAVSSYRRIPTPSYGGPDVDRRVETIASVKLAADARSANIELNDLRPGFVYEFHLNHLTHDPSALWFPAEAHYTLRGIPQ